MPFIGTLCRGPCTSPPSGRGSNTSQILAARKGLANHVVDHMAVQVGEGVVAAGVAILELAVIEAQQVQDRGVQVMGVHFVLYRNAAELVGGAVAEPTFHAAAGHPDGEPAVVVVAAFGAGTGENACRGRAAE